MVDEEELIKQVSDMKPVDEYDEPVDAVLLKFIVVADFIDGEGSRYMVKKAMSGSGDKVPTWDEIGLLQGATTLF